MVLKTSDFYGKYINYIYQNWSAGDGEKFFVEISSNIDIFVYIFSTIDK